MCCPPALSHNSSGNVTQRFTEIVALITEERGECFGYNKQGYTFGQALHSVCLNSFLAVGFMAFHLHCLTQIDISFSLKCQGLRRET